MRVRLQSLARWTQSHSTANTIKSIFYSSVKPGSTILLVMLSSRSLIPATYSAATVRLGGVCVLTRKHFNVIRVDTSPTTEMVSVDILDGKSRVRLLCCYKSSTGPIHIRRERVRALCSDISNCASTDQPFIVLGDFNLPSIDWTNLSLIDCTNIESILTDCCYHTNLCQLVHSSTHRDGGTLDLLLTTDPDLVEEVRVIRLRSHLTTSRSLSVFSRSLRSTTIRTLLITTKK